MYIYTKMLGPAPRKVVLLLEPIQFFCEASYDARGRERGDALCCTATPDRNCQFGPIFSEKEDQNFE